ncbi:MULTISPECIES: TetR/AcrR family transcriptional regulator [unclassified Marinobacter]|jgi:AcrR family transcriptional regulator|uniref:TetR/AcrR family transcriptional regulator n=1 Tax=unclassified Marinobacter TaxID=83889 RepID=UPI00071D99DF|nr:MULTISPECIES: TetR/AcrR family transcriptional regulator [unclassified Marinobacter]KRW82745.1 TetR family transcriptional regulator [Marinobacter sp. P4B1]MCE0757847.1 TetR/AcrR family transcriptional regulator [Marinobacter sp. G11]PTB93084.1 TetR/AcrR family transcriptional regulator [Marinobacter sp. Z-F4-2]
MNQSNILENRFPGRRAALKREILEQALHCFNDLGVEATTIDAIKARCDTSVGAIYHHFGNKEGILSALFFAAMDDQRQQLERELAGANNLREAVFCIIESYLDWVAANREWARFLYQARSPLAKGPFQQELKDRNIQNYQKLKEQLIGLGKGDIKIVQPFEMLFSLIIGPSENYCRAWLSGRVKTSPQEYRKEFAESAWRSLKR